MNANISVIMPIYNPPKIYLQKALDSIISQTFKKIEIILILDGSKTEIEQLCREYEKKDHRIYIFKQENKGEGAARNKGIELAKSPWITFVDADDWLELDTLEKLYKKTEQGDNSDIIVYDCYVEYKEKQVKNKFYIKDGILSKLDQRELQLQNIGKGLTKYFPTDCNVSVVWGKLYKKEFITENDLKFIEGVRKAPDTIFHLLALEKAKTISHYNIYGYHYRKNTSSVTQKQDSTTKHDAEIFLNSVKKYIEQFNKDEDFEKTYNISVLTMVNNILLNDFSTIPYKQRKNKIKELLETPVYKEALTKIPKEKISLYQKYMLYNIKKGNVRILEILVKIKKHIKKVQRKESQ